MNIGEKKIKVIGVIMTYNCASMLEDLWHRIPRDVLDEIILVDDESVDETLGESRRLGIPSFTHEHLGYGGNLRFGFKKALELSADAVIEIHGDGQFDPSVIPHAVEKLKNGCDFLIGSRFTDLLQPLKDGMPFSRYVANIGLSFIERIVLRIPLSEFHAGFRAYSRRLLQTVGCENGANDYLYSFEIIAMGRHHNIDFCEIPVRADYKKEHTSVNIGRAVVNSFQELYVLLLYILAQLGIKKTKLFP